MLLTAIYFRGSVGLSDGYFWKLFASSDAPHDELFEIEESELFRSSSSDFSLISFIAERSVFCRKVGIDYSLLNFFLLSCC